MTRTQERPDQELRELCARIVAERLTEGEWAARESDDMFQSEHYCGGYDSDESAFCFSKYHDDGSESWFQVTLAEVNAIAKGEPLAIAMRPSEAGA